MAGEKGVAPVELGWYGRDHRDVGRGGTAANTGLPAPVATLLPPNPCLVTAFAEEQRRKCRAQDCGFGNPKRYMKIVAIS